VTCDLVANFPQVNAALGLSGHLKYMHLKTISVLVDGRHSDTPVKHVGDRADLVHAKSVRALAKIVRIIVSKGLSQVVQREHILDEGSTTSSTRLASSI
jgi:hypothetical protein